MNDRLIIFPFPCCFFVADFITYLKIRNGSILFCLFFLHNFSVAFLYELLKIFVKW